MSQLFQKMIEEKKASQGKEISPVEKEATGNVLQDLMQYLSSMQGDKVKGLKKVTVASNDPKGLVEGLSKAKDLVKDGSEDGLDESSEDESQEDPTEEDSESPELEASEDEHGSDDESHDPKELLKQIELLKAQLASK